MYVPSNHVHILMNSQTFTGLFHIMTCNVTCDNATCGNVICNNNVTSDNGNSDNATGDKVTCNNVSTSLPPNKTHVFGLNTELILRRVRMLRYSSLNLVSNMKSITEFTFKLY